MTNPTPIRRVSARKYRGLGDVVEIAAKPIAKAIDSITGSKIASCGACQKRREKLNKAFPVSRG